MKKCLFLLAMVPLFILSCSSENNDVLPPGYVSLFVRFSSTSGENIADSLELAKYVGNNLFASIGKGDLQMDVSTSASNNMLSICNDFWMKENLRTGVLSSCLHVDIFQHEVEPSQECTLFLGSPKIFGDTKRHTISWRAKRVPINSMTFEECKIDGVPCPVVEEISYKKNCYKIANQKGNLADYVINIVVDRK
nr:hypothetical protein [uncultured Prevotella sp.]